MKSCARVVCQSLGAVPEQLDEGVFLQTFVPGSISLSHSWPPQLSQSPLPIPSACTALIPLEASVEQGLFPTHSPGTHSTSLQVRAPDLPSISASLYLIPFPGPSFSVLIKW